MRWALGLVLVAACGNVDPTGGYVLFTSWPDDGCGRSVAGEKTLHLTIDEKDHVTIENVAVTDTSVRCDGDCRVEFSYAMGIARAKIDLRISDEDTVTGTGVVANPGISDITICPFPLTITGQRTEAFDD